MDNNYSKELCHHGILGMHWGIRRFQPYGQGYDSEREGKYLGDLKRTSKDYTKKLNKLQKQSEKHQAIAQEHEKYNQRYTKKSNEAYAKGKNKKALKYANKALEDRKARDDHYDEVKKLDSITNKIIADAASNNFDITQNMTRRYVDAGDNWLRYMGALLIGPIPATMLTSHPQMVDSNRYTVRKNYDPNKTVGDLTYVVDPSRMQKLEAKAVQNKMAYDEGMKTLGLLKDKVGSSTVATTLNGLASADASTHNLMQQQIQQQILQANHNYVHQMTMTPLGMRF